LKESQRSAKLKSSRSRKNGQHKKWDFWVSQVFRGEKLVNINIEVPDDIHKRIKILAAMQGIAIKEFITNTLEENAEHEGK
jgi:predicted DNA binding CopG/RHH family protein